MTMMMAAATLLGVAVVLSLGAIVLPRRVDPVTRALDALERTSPNAESLRREAERPFVERVVAPVHERASRIGRRITGADKADRLQRRLDVAGNPHDWGVDHILAFKVVGATALPPLALAYCTLLGFGLTTTAVAAAAAVAVGFFAADMYVYHLGYERSAAIRGTLADAVDLLAISVEAGLGFDAALQQVATNTTGPFAEELARLLREMQLGRGRAEALRRLGERTDLPELKSFVSAMVQADAFGVSVASVLRSQAGEMRLKRRQYAEAKARQVPVKMMVPLVLCILPCLLIVVIGPAAIEMYRTLDL
ncbi:type II secretion system F family protein [Nocardioides sp. GY 10113]|uniref:type II secretion system F family protein n=1 Tax=Nocardioides sp. GY 10113 TaxID=2569761 RepID=UPI0010A8F064|nr:type II secretion system F family protein [Nocardioides sp. GY 10113]TIC88686.1 type II secretion system F family protein [Nocardioides sp. GY 10113]